MKLSLVSRRPLIRASVTLMAIAAGAPGLAQPQARPTSPPGNTGELPIGSDVAADTLLADAQALAPEIRVGVRYATSNSFTGAPIAGYNATTGRPLDMGTPFDTFSPAAHTANPSGVALENRHHLPRLMEAKGFVNYDQEWWHYTHDVPDPVRFDRVIY
jgi:D-alanyl-D-alanine dipeptidase